MDSKIEFNELCRLCLARKHVNIHIFEGEGCKAGIFLKISTCLPVNISLEDKLPKRICSNCFTKLNTLYQFYNKAVNSEKQLLEWFNECATENDNETFLDNNVDTEMSQDNSEVEVKEEELSFLPEEDNYNIKLEEVNVQDNMLQDIPHEINEMSHEKCSDIIESKAVTNGEVDTLKYEDVEDGSSVTPNSLRNEINSKYAKDDLNNEDKQETIAVNVSENTESISIGTKSNLDYDLLQAQHSPFNVPVSQQYEIFSPSVLPTLQGNSVFKLLDNTDEGKLIKSTYGPFKKFRRSHLCNLITKHELQKSPDNRISTERFKTLAQEINEIFTHEDAVIYYIPYTKGINGKVVAASGKLWSAYVHQRKILREAGLLHKRKEEPSTSTSLVNENEEKIDNELHSTEMLTWLHHNSIPFEEVAKRWKKTATMRRQLKANETIGEYYKKYPALNLQTGYLLLELDFDHLHKGKENVFLSRWPALANPIYDMITKKHDTLTKDFLAQEKLKFENIDDDAKQIIALKLLPFLLQFPLIKAKANIHWKPTRTEMLDGFILFIDNESNLTKAVEERRLKHQNFTMPVQPIPIIVGTYKCYQCYVSVNEQLYKVENPLRAVDVCFKVYHALNTDYPPESTPAWLFLQKGIYNIDTNLNKKYRSVDVLIATLKVILD